MKKTQFTALSEALRLRGLGWSIIPLRPGLKKPAVRWKEFQERVATEAEIRDWFGCGARYQLGVVVGPVSGGLIVRDFDTKESYEEWVSAEESRRRFPAVQTVRGFHVYARIDFATDPSPLLEKSEHKFSDGSGELKLYDHYTVLPPSNHPKGARYKWLGEPPTSLDDIPLTDLSSLDWGPSGSQEPAEKISDKHTRAIERDRKLAKRACNHEEQLQLTKDKHVRAAIKKTLPRKEGQRNRCIFLLASELQMVPSLKERNKFDFAEVVKLWCKKAEAMTRTPFHETWADFLRGWERAGKERILDGAAKLAEEGPYPEVIKALRDRVVEVHCGLCRELQKRSGTEPFFLSCRDAARCLNEHKATSHKLLRMLCENYGVLEMVERGTSGKKGKATVWRYLGPIENA